MVFVIFIYALFGMKLWIGVLEGRCALPYGVVGADGRESSLRHCNLALAATPMKPGVPSDSCVPTSEPEPNVPAAGLCCAPERCFVAGDPDGGFTSFNSIHAAILTVFNTMTLEGWSGTVFALTQSDGGPLVYIYFGSLLVVGGLLVTNYLLAECCIVFGMHMENVRLAAELRLRRLRLQSIGKFKRTTTILSMMNHHAKLPNSGGGCLHNGDSRKLYFEDIDGSATARERGRQVQAVAGDDNSGTF